MLKVVSPQVVNKRKTQIELDLKKNPDDPRYTFCTPPKSKSAVWEHFHVVKFNDQVERYAQCKNCKDILSYSTKCGTGSLLRHKCIKRSNNKYTKSFPLLQIKNEDNKSAAQAEHINKKENANEESLMTYENFEALEEEAATAAQPKEENHAIQQQQHDVVDTQEEDDDMNSCSDLKSPINVKDMYDAFGENVANEMRQLRDVEEVQFQLKTAILKSILEANTAAHALRKLKTKKIKKKLKTYTDIC